MLKKIGKNKAKFLLAVISVVLFTSEMAFAKKKSELVKEEAGYYYGYGKASTNEEAVFMAKKNLIVNALTATVRLADPTAADVVISDDVVEARLADEKPFEQSKNGLTVTYRMRVSEWDKKEKEYASTLRKTLGPKYNTFVSSTNVAEKLEIASSILSTLAKNGVSDTMTLQEKGTELFAQKIKDIAKHTSVEKIISISPSESLPSALKKAYKLKNIIRTGWVLYMLF